MPQTVIAEIGSRTRIVRAIALPAIGVVVAAAAGRYRHHAVIEWDPERGATLRDERPVNGTFVNNREIAPMLADGPRIDRRKLAAKAEEVDGKVRKLTAIRDALRHAAVCPAPSHMQCPTFLRILRVAGKRARRGAAPAGSALKRAR